MPVTETAASDSTVRYQVLAVAIRNPYDVVHHAQAAAGVVTYGYAASR